jgi:hypothetical protein
MRANTRTVVSTPPRSLLPGFGPPAGHAGLQRLNRNARGGPWEKSGASERETVGEKAMGQSPGGRRPMGMSVLFLASFLAASFPCQRFPDMFFFAGLQVKGVALDLLNDAFLLHLALEAAQRIFEGFSLFNPDFRQNELHPQTRPDGPDSYCNILQASQGGIATREL